MIPKTALPSRGLILRLSYLLRLGDKLGIVVIGDLSSCRTNTLSPDGSEIPLERSTQAQGSPLVAEYFAVNGGKIRQIQAVLLTAKLNSPTGW